MSKRKRRRERAWQEARKKARHQQYASMPAAYRLTWVTLRDPDGNLLVDPDGNQLGFYP